MTKKEILNLIDASATDYNRQTTIAQEKLNALKEHNGSETEIEWANPRINTHTVNTPNNPAAICKNKNG